MTRQALFLAILLALPAAAQDVPDFASVSGHAFGERITVHHEMARYLEALDEASPRVRVVDQGTSWEGRRLLLAIVTSPANHARLDAIQRNAERLGDPRQVPPGEVESLIEGQPAVVWLGGSIHGFELSGSEGLLKLLEHLTTKDDEDTREVLDRTVVLIDPMLNPDGRDAFAAFNHQRVGREPNAAREDWSNQTTRWQGLQFRTGHYFFDTNRDWFAHTQLETRNRMATFRRWRPQVAIDAHEMGPDTEFYFDPPLDPYGIYFPPHAKRWFERFSAAYVAAFDAAGFEYTTRELFNFYYPGYTTSYNSYQGAVGMLYEQGSSRGLALERGDGTVRRLADAANQQYTAAWTAVATAARERRTLLAEFHDALRQSLGEAEVSRYLIAPEGDPLLVRELVAMLLRNGIEVAVLEESVELAEVRGPAGQAIGSRAFPAGSYVIDTAQPRQRLLRTLLEPDLPVPGNFLAEARRRVDRGENPRFYDITAWSLPLLFHVGGYSSTDGRRLEARQLTEPSVLEEPSATEAGYAYLVDGRAAASLAVAHHLRQRGYRTAVTRKPTRIGGHHLASGSAVVRVGTNDEGVHAAVRELAGHYGVEVRAVGTGHADSDRGEGTLPTLGSVETIALKPTSVALLAEQPVHGYSFGWAWHTLDRQYEIPVTVLPGRAVTSTPLHPFQTIVVPHLLSAPELAGLLGDDGLGRLAQWVEDGGNLVALGSGVEFVLQHLRRQGGEDGAGHLKLTGLRSWYEENKTNGEDGEEPRRFGVPGAILRAELDRETWLTAGYGTAELPFLINSDSLYLPPAGPPNAGRRVAVRIAEAGDVRIAGHVWPETLERVPGAVLAYDERAGNGRVILFPEDLNFRAYWRGVNRLFLNAVLLGPSAP